MIAAEAGACFLVSCGEQKADGYHCRLVLSDAGTVLIFPRYLNTEYFGTFQKILRHQLLDNI